VIILFIYDIKDYILLLSYVMLAIEITFDIITLDLLPFKNPL